MYEYSDLARRKIQLYFAATHLFERGKSHPQIVEILSEYEYDSELVTSIVDDAMNDLWRKIFNEAQLLFSQGKTYQEVFDAVKSMEADKEIVHFICNTWYDVQSAYVENLLESQTNIWEGVQWIIISSLGVVFVFAINASLFSKIIWVLGLVSAILTWLYGLKQKKLAGQIRKILDEDYSKFDKLI